MSDPTPTIPQWQMVQDGTWTDGRRVASYRTPPNLLTAPAFAAPAGWEVLAPPVLSRASARWMGQLRQLPPVPPPVTPTPTPPVQPPVTPAVVVPQPVTTRTRYVADPSVASRGTPFPTYKVNHQADQLIINAHVEGFEQNVVGQSIAPGGIILDNVAAVGAWSDTGKYLGQGVYCEDVAGRAVLRNSLFAFNGVGRPPTRTPRMFAHGAYLNAGAQALVSGCIFAGNANAGVQLRQGGRVENCIFLDCGTAIELVMGGCTVEHCSILGAHLYLDDGGNGAGGSAIYAYNPINLSDVWIQGVAGQCSAVPNHPEAKCFPRAALVWGGNWTNGGHPQFVAPAPGVSLINATNVNVYGWGAGAVDAGQQVPTGVNVSPNACGPDALAKAYAVVDRVLANTLAVPDAVAQLHSLIRGAVALSANPSLASLPAAPSH